MFEDLSRNAGAEPKPVHSIVVSGNEDGGVLIRQRMAAAREEICVVVPPEQAEGLIAAIRRHLNPGK